MIGGGGVRRDRCRRPLYCRGHVEQQPPALDFGELLLDETAECHLRSVVPLAKISRDGPNGPRRFHCRFDQERCLGASLSVHDEAVVDECPT